MNEQHYRVGEKTFKNNYAGIYHSAQTGHFCEFIMPQKHIDSFLTVDIASLSQYTSRDLMRKKLCMLRDEYNKIRFHYTGGQDSHTIMLIAQDLGIAFEDVFTHPNTIIADPKDEYEFVPGIEYVKTTGMSHIIHRPTIDDLEEVWCDPECFLKFEDFYHGVYPMFTDMFMRNYEQDYIELLGMEKPWYYASGNRYYWLLHDVQDYCTITLHEDFYSGSYMPELAVKQAVKGLEYIKNYYPDKQGFIDYKMLDIKSFTNYLELDTGIDVKINKTIEDYSTKGNLSEKHKRCLYQIQKMGRWDIIDNWVSRGFEIAKKLQSASHGIHVQKFWEPKIKREVCMTTPAVRIGAIFEILPDRLELVPHCDINLLT